MCDVTKWEHKVEWVYERFPLEDVINEFGATGWELVAITVEDRDSSHSPLQYLVAFKRPLSNPANDTVGLT